MRGALRALAGILLVLAPQPASARTIDEAVRKGLAISPDLRAYDANVRAADTDVKIARSGYYPSLSVSGGPQSVDLDGFAYDLTAAQMLYDWGRVRGEVDGARAARTKLSEQARAKRDEIALDIVEAYLDIIVTDRQVAAVGTYIGQLDKLADMTKARSGGGYSDRSEPERAALELARAREQMAIEQGTLADARNRYRILVGEEPANLVEPPAPAAFERYLARNDMTLLIRAAPLYRTTVADADAADATLRQSRASLYPQVNVEASTLRRPVGGIAQTDTVVALRLRMNTQGFAAFLRPGGAAERLQAARLNEDASERDTRRQLQTLADSATMLSAREEALRAQVATSDAVGETYLEQFTVSRRDLIDILNTRRENFEAKRQLASVHIDYLRLRYRAAARLGLLGPLLEGGLS